MQVPLSLFFSFFAIWGLLADGTSWTKQASEAADGF